jgi:hypothetical protein
MGASSSTVTFDVEGKGTVTKTALAHLYKATPRISIGEDSSSSEPFGFDYDDIVVRVK